MPQIRSRSELTACKPRASGPRAADAGPALAAVRFNEPALQFWLGAFYCVHSNHPPQLPVAIRTVDCPIVTRSGQPILDCEGRQKVIRCVWVLTRQAQADGAACWRVIEWLIDLYGLRSTDCSSEQDAIACFERAPVPVQMG